MLVLAAGGAPARPRRAKGMAPVAKVPKEYLESGSEKGVNYEYQPSWRGMFVAKEVYSCSVSYGLPEACRLLYKKRVESRKAMRRCLQ